MNFIIFRHCIALHTFHCGSIIYNHIHCVIGLCTQCMPWVACIFRALRSIDVISRPWERYIRSIYGKIIPIGCNAISELEKNVGDFWHLQSITLLSQFFLSSSDELREIFRSPRNKTKTRLLVQPFKPRICFINIYDSVPKEQSAGSWKMDMPSVLCGTR